jgi:hypothetical protein
MHKALNDILSTEKKKKGIKPPPPKHYAPVS